MCQILQHGLILLMRTLINATSFSQLYDVLKVIWSLTNLSFIIIFQLVSKCKLYLSNTTVFSIKPSFSFHVIIQLFVHLLILYLYESHCLHIFSFLFLFTFI